MEGVLEGVSEKGFLKRTLKRERNTYLGRVIIRGSLCLLYDWTPPPGNWLPEFFRFFVRLIYRKLTFQIGNNSNHPACIQNNNVAQHAKSNSITLFVRVKRWYYLALAVGVLAGAAYIYWRADAPGFSRLRHLWDPSANADQAAETAGRSGWQVVDRSDDGFRIDMPGDPREAQAPAYNEVGGAEPVQMLVANRGPDTVFAITWQDNAPVLRSNDYGPERALNTARDGMLNRTRTSLISQSSSVQHGYPSLDVLARNAQGGILQARLILSGNRLYILMGLFSSSGAVSNQDVSRFFESFIPSESGAPESAGARKNPTRSAVQP